MFIASKAKKLVLVLVSSLSITVANEEAVSVVTLSPKTPTSNIKISAIGFETPTSTTIYLLLLERISYIYYLLRFKKDKDHIEALINFDIEVNTIIPTYATN